MTKDKIIKFSFVIFIALITTSVILYKITVEDTIKYFSFVFLFTDIVYDYLKENKSLEKFYSFKSSHLEVFISLVLAFLLTIIIVIFIKPLITLKPTIEPQTVKFDTIDVIILFFLVAKLFNTVLKDNPSTKKIGICIKHFLFGYSLKEFQEALK